MSENNSPQPHYPYGPPPQAPQQPEESNPFLAGPPPQPGQQAVQQPYQQTEQHTDNPFAGGPPPPSSESSATAEDSEGSSVSATAAVSGASGNGTKIAIAVLAVLTVAALIAAAVLFTRGGSGNGEESSPATQTNPTADPAAASASGEPDANDPDAATDEDVPGIDIPDDSTGSVTSFGDIQGIEPPKVLTDKIDPNLISAAELTKSDSPVAPGQDYSLHLTISQAGFDNPHDLFANINEIAQDHCFSWIKVETSDPLGPNSTVGDACYQDIAPEEWGALYEMLRDVEWTSISQYKGLAGEPHTFNVHLPEMSGADFQATYAQLSYPEGISLTVVFTNSDTGQMEMWESTSEGLQFLDY